MPTAVDFGAIAVAGIAAGSAYLSNRSANKATTTNTVVGSRLDAEKEAYERARKFDLETIQRQDAEIRELRTEVHSLRIEVAKLQGFQEGKDRGSPGSDTLGGV